MATKKSTATPAKPATKSANKTSAPSASKIPAKSSAASAKEAVPTTASKHAAGKQAPTHEEISHLAHQYWKERGHRHGSHEDDWRRAEQELTLKSRS